MKEFIRDTIEITVTNLWGGFLWLVGGILILLQTYKNRNDKEKTSGGLYYYGWGAGIGAIILGLLVIYWNLTGTL